MLGAIFGDIVGSVYEFHNVKSMEFPLLSRNSQPTDEWKNQWRGYNSPS